MKKIMLSDQLIANAKRKFLIFSILGITIIVAISVLAIRYHNSVIDRQANIQRVHDALGGQMLLLHEIALVGEMFAEDLSKEREWEIKEKFNDLIFKLNDENKKFIKSLETIDYHALDKIEKIVNENNLHGQMFSYMKRARELSEKKIDSIQEIKADISFLALNSRAGLSDAFIYINKQIKQYNADALSKIDRIGLMLVFLSTFEFILIWALVFRPLYVAVITQHEKLQESSIEIQSANRSRSEFLSNISHEIRTPMTSILGYAEILQQDTGMSSEKKSSALQIINQNAQHLLSLIDELLDVSKIESGKMKINFAEINLPKLLKEVHKTLQVKAQEKGLELNFKNKNSIPQKIWSDSKRLKQILFNIIGNGIKFTDKGYVELSVEYFNGDKMNYDRLIFWVEDTGRGISSLTQKKLFRPFEQVDGSEKREFGGTGLGLVLAKGLAQSMGGNVSIAESKEGVGTTFKIEVEIERDANSRLVSNVFDLNENEKNKTQRWNNKTLYAKKILIVEDAIENARLFKMNLAFAGAEADVAYNGFQAIEKIRESDFDLVLLDIQMPGKDGFEVLSDLRCASFKKPVIALTAHAMDDIKQKIKKAGFDGHISKPVTFEQLILSVKEQLKG